MGGYIPGGGGGAYNRKCFLLLSGIWVFKWGAYKWGGGLYKRTVYGINGIHARLLYRPP